MMRQMFTRKKRSPTPTDEQRGLQFDRPVRVIVIPLVLALSVFASLSLMSAITGSVSVEAPHITQTTLAAPTANDLKPLQCSALTLSTIVGGGTNLSVPSADSTLALADANTVTMVGNSGDDCLVGGGATASIDGGTGTDVCIAKNGTTAFDPSCETTVSWP